VIDTKLQQKMYRTMLRIRLVEERIVELYSEQEMRCPTHFSIGQEAIAVGVCAHLLKQDYVMSAHRSHAHYLAKGGDLKRMLAELYGKETGCAHGKGGSMHLVDTTVGFLGCVPIVGSTIPIGVGIAFGAKMQQEPGITVIFFGEGATETGVFHESINYAAVHQLPILFVCENNLYSVNTPLLDRQPVGRKIIDLAKGHGVEAYQCDGQECDEVYNMTAPLIKKMRQGGGPAFLEFFTYRFLEHCGPNQDLALGYRTEGEYEKWLERDPVFLYRELLLKNGALTPAEIDRLYNKFKLEIDQAFLFAKQSPFPHREALMFGVYPESTEKEVLKKEKTCQIEN
jgi:TPP-dependent pyruvate/acetoin dehydrogenase alpha subunit